MPPPVRRVLTQEVLPRSLPAHPARVGLVENLEVPGERLGDAGGRNGFARFRNGSGNGFVPRGALLSGIVLGVSSFRFLLQGSGGIDLDAFAGLVVAGDG